MARYRARLDEQALVHSSLDAEMDEALPTDHATSVAITIALSYDQLDLTPATDGAALDLLARLAWCAPAPIPQRLIVRLFMLNPDADDAAEAVDPLLWRLRVLGLLDHLDTGGVALHRLVGAFVRSASSRGPTRLARARSWPTA